VTAIPAQNQTVEEILASIRAAITDDDAKRGIARAAVGPSAAMRPAVARVGSVIPERAMDRDEDDGATDDGATDDESEAQDMIDIAIEKAIDGVKAELGNGTAEAEAARRPMLDTGGGNRQTAARPRPANARPEMRRPPPPRPSQPLLSARTDAAVSASFGDLARTMIQGSTRPLDEIVEDMLRPMLRGWLDDNLPLMVERLVREEIERVSRGRG